jgi:protease PrsW
MVSEAYSFSSVGVIYVDYALPFSVVVAAIYLAIVRFMDLNEKEPLWALGLMLVLGTIAAVIVDLLVSDVLLGPSTLWQALVEVSAQFVAFYLGAVALTAVARMRGWLEINDLMDGIVYGTAVGLGFAVGETFVREYLFGQIYEIREPAVLAALGTTALWGLSYGLFGAIIGAGFGAAVGAHTALRRVGYIVAGLIGAILTYWLYEFLAHGGPLGGLASLTRTWVALLIPLLFVIGVAGFALYREKQVIREELADESQTGAVTEEELAVLTSSLARRSHRTRVLGKGNFHHWHLTRELHDRQVQLAFAKRRAREERRLEHRIAIEHEVERLRASVHAMKRELEGPTGSPDATRGGAS